MKKTKLISYILIAMLAISLVSCATSKRQRMERDCDCGSFSDTEIVTHETHT